MTNKTIPKNLPIPKSTLTIEQIIDNSLNILQECEKIPQMYDHSFDVHQKTCHRILEDIQSNYLKIAVVGAIKSGKSTFINSLIGKDLVKRGAGVVTSITTRIRKGKKNRAHIYFKSWDTINLQLQRALELFPGSPDCDEFKSKNFSDFDIRRNKDREILKKIFKILTSDFPVSKKGIQPETLLIKHAIQGFDTCKKRVKPDETSLIFESKEFEQHKIFTSDPDIAFYIKDVCLELYGKIIDPDIEIADCQGADSIDPGQLSHILNYLESSNLIIYCISSRTGLRQADIEFLNQIKNLGLLDNVIFINNCDFSEHENLDDLIKIEKGIKESLEFLEIHPRVFSLSALYNLFYQFSMKGKSKLNKKEKIRLKLWQEEKKIIQYCDLHTSDFNEFFKEMIDKNRQDFLFFNHFKRLTAILSHVQQHADIFLDLLSSDKSKETKTVQTLDLLEQNATRLESMVKKSIGNYVQDLKDKIHQNLHNAFVHDHADVLSKTLDYINNAASIDVEQYKTCSESSFNQILYLMFQDFKRRLDIYELENVKPELKSFVKTQEELIISYFHSLFDSLKIDLLKDDNPGAVENLSNPEIIYDGAISFENIKKILGIEMPGPVFEAKYTSKIKANVFTGFSFHTISGILSSLFKKNNMFSFSPGLNTAALKIRQENLKLIKAQFRQFFINMENDYFTPLIDAVTRDFKEKINERFAMYHSYKKEAEDIFSLKLCEKQDTQSKIKLILQQIQQENNHIAAQGAMIKF
ncbi:MAG: dynamin family protein [Desulfobacula sp.]|nr:dynamin family protein [Desulfobacula sp.]